MQICTPYIFAKQNLLHLTYSVQVVVECRRGSCDVSTLLERMGENWNNEYMLMGFSESHIFCCSMIYDFHFTQSTNITVKNLPEKGLTILVAVKIKYILLSMSNVKILFWNIRFWRKWVFTDLNLCQNQSWAFSVPKMCLSDGISYLLNF